MITRPTISFIFTAATTTVLLFSGCARDLAAEAGSGRVAIDFSTDVAVRGVEATRAVEDESQLESLPGLVAPEASEFSLSIVPSGADSGWKWDALTDYVPQQMLFDAGEYVAAAYYGNAEEEGFDKPAFGAEEQFSINHNQTTPLSLTARLTNMAVTVSYTEAFKKYFPDHNATIIRNDAEVVGFARDEERAAYIKPLPFTLRVDYTYQNNGNSERKGYSLHDVEQYVGACRWLRATFDANGGDVGGALITVEFGDLEPTELDPIDVGDEN